MELKVVVQWLLDNQYGILVNNQFVLTQKLNQELFGVPSIPIVVEEVKSLIIKPKIDNLKAIWNKFILDAQIPHRVNSPGGGVYTIRQYNIPAAKALQAIIADPAIEYNRLIASTKSYYTTVSYKTTLSNYLLKDVWKGEYDHYGSKSPTDGSNRFES